MNLSTLTKELGAEKASAHYTKNKSIKGLVAVKGSTGTRYSQKAKADALSLLDEKLGFKTVQEMTGIADSTLRYWHKEALKVNIMRLLKKGIKSCIIVEKTGAPRKKVSEYKAEFEKGRNHEKYT
jgi:hypothetical protein